MQQIQKWPYHCTNQHCCTPRKTFDTQLSKFIWYHSLYTYYFRCFSSGNMDQNIDDSQLTYRVWQINSAHWYLTTSGFNILFAGNTSTDDIKQLSSSQVMGTLKGLCWHSCFNKLQHTQIKIHSEKHKDSTATHFTTETNCWDQSRCTFLPFVEGLYWSRHLGNFSLH